MTPTAELELPPAPEAEALPDRDVIGGEPLDSPDVMAPALGGLELTEREREILLLLGTGKTNREIAERLHLGPDSIKKSATVLYRKLGVRNRTEAARRAELLLG
ncbi:MAG: helix-turn-helix transcriptional regulator [Proteobacteria bacterium]|nr:helix-turn-helix transcriptional regulator [Pseudomonadota bacterium]